MYLRKKDAILAWHILPRSMKLGFGDGRKAKVGKILSVPGKPKLCFRGLHASRQLFQARHYNESIDSRRKICRVLIWGNIEEGFDKLVGNYRQILYTISPFTPHSPFESTEAEEDFFDKKYLPQRVGRWRAPQKR